MPREEGGELSAGAERHVGVREVDDEVEGGGGGERDGDRLQQDLHLRRRAPSDRAPLEQVHARLRGGPTGDGTVRAGVDVEEEEVRRRVERAHEAGDRRVRKAPVRHDKKGERRASGPGRSRRRQLDRRPRPERHPIARRAPQPLVDGGEAGGVCGGRRGLSRRVTSLVVEQLHGRLPATSSVRQRQVSPLQLMRCGISGMCEPGETRKEIEWMCDMRARVTLLERLDVSPGRGK